MLEKVNRPVISLVPTPNSAGARIMSDDKEVASLPPHMCIKWAIMLLQASGQSELRIKIERP